jgi:3-hydroxyethyl bacteriochlorophyllide a dehydrogenase
MSASAIILEAPGELSLRTLALTPTQNSDVVVDIAWSGISSGTERLLWEGRMPTFPGMGYPLVPGYESVGRIVDAGTDARGRIGEWVFVPGANCYEGARGLFGGASSRVVVPSARVMPVPESLGAQGILCALAATAQHAIAGHAAPDLIVGHGVLGRLLARITVASGAPAPTVWETNPVRRDGAQGYVVTDAESDERRDYRAIYDASGAEGLTDLLIARLARGGELVLAGFYTKPISFTFPPAFMREAKLRIAAEFLPADMAATSAMIEQGGLDLDGLVTDVRPVGEFNTAYPQAFTDAACLKMVLDWSSL